MKYTNILFLVLILVLLLTACAKNGKEIKITKKSFVEERCLCNAYQSGGRVYVCKNLIEAFNDECAVKATKELRNDTIECFSCLRVLT